MVQGHSFDQSIGLAVQAWNMGFAQAWAILGGIRATSYQIGAAPSVVRQYPKVAAKLDLPPTSTKEPRIKERRNETQLEVEGVHGGSRQTDAASINCHSLSCQPFSRICRRCLAFGFYCDTVGFMSATVLVCFENFDDARLG